MTHTIKIKESFADAIMNGDRTFEVRKNDRGYQKGDIVVFQAIEDTASLPLSIVHPINHNKYVITYVLSDWGIEKGYVVFGIKRMEEK